MNTITTDITAVIPTLGDQSVIKAIEAMNTGTIKPKEILICMPIEYTKNFIYELPANTRVIETEVKGQVAQRQVGFRAAKTTYVLQVDDDIFVSKTCIQTLLTFLTNTNGPVCVAPRLIDINNGEDLNRPIKDNVLYRFLYWLFNGKEGYKESSIMKCGFNCRFPAPVKMKTPVKTEWLPGGIVLHKKEFVVTKPFYPYPGKAYCEDLLHSYMLKKNGVTLYMHHEARAYYKYYNIYSWKLKDFLNNIFHDFRIRRYFVRISKRSTIRLCIYYLLQFQNYFFFYISNRVRTLFH